MPSWKKVIISGSDASLNSLDITTYISASRIQADAIAAASITGSVLGTSSFAATASNLQGGTQNYIPLWNSNTTQTASIIQQSGTNLQVAGNISASSITASFSGSGANLVNVPTTLNITGVNGTGQVRLLQDNLIVTGSGGIIADVSGSTITIRASGLVSSSDGQVSFNSIIDKPTLVSSSAQINTGSFSGSFIGQLIGTSSVSTTAISASFATNADLLDGLNSTVFATTGSNIFSGSQNISGSVQVAAAITASAILVSGSGTQRLRVVGSGSAQPIFTIEGSQGELFSITDSLSGSLFSVSDISGLPILEVFSDDTVLLGDYAAPALHTTKKLTLTTGSNIIYSVPTASYDSVYLEYHIKSGSNGRAGNVMAMYVGTTAQFTDFSTLNVGSTTNVKFEAFVSGANFIITGSVPTNNWTLKTIIRAI
jgi:hypothetical protein